jgi:hypothetical protein
MTVLRQIITLSRNPVRTDGFSGFGADNLERVALRVTPVSQYCNMLYVLAS